MEEDEKETPEEKLNSDDDDNKHGDESKHPGGGTDSQKEIEKGIADYADTVRAHVPSSSETKKLLAANFSPGPMDVILARGKKAYNHPGNRRLREMIGENLKLYSEAETKLDKSSIVSRIMDHFRQASPGGGFVRDEGGQWYEVGDRLAREKISQSFRDLLHTKYRSSTKAKARRKEMRAKSMMAEMEEGKPFGIREIFQAELGKLPGTQATSEAAKQVVVQQESVPVESVQPECLKSESVQEETVPQESVLQETTQEETNVQQESVLEKIVQQENVPIESVLQESVIQQETDQEDTALQQSAQHEALEASVSDIHHLPVPVFVEGNRELASISHAKVDPSHEASTTTSPDFPHHQDKGPDRSAMCVARGIDRAFFPIRRDSDSDIHTIDFFPDEGFDSSLWDDDDKKPSPEQSPPK